MVVAPVVTAVSVMVLVTGTKTAFVTTLVPGTKVLVTEVVAVAVVVVVIIGVGATMVDVKGTVVEV